MACYRNGGCGPYEMYSCSECPASKPEYAQKPSTCSQKEQARLIDASDKRNLLYVSQEVFDYMQCIPPIDPESKPLEAFLHPIDAYKGLKAKYLVFKADTGERVDNCFILRPDKDPAAVAALRAYAAATDNKILTEDIYNWVGKGESLRPQGEWSECDWVEYDGHGECIHHPKAGLRCSNCCNAFKKELLWKDNYCPNCGACMKGAGEDA